jgi:hypothetical protein
MALKDSKTFFGKHFLSLCILLAAVSVFVYFTMRNTALKKMYQHSLDIVDSYKISESNTVSSALQISADFHFTSAGLGTTMVTDSTGQAMELAKIAWPAPRLLFRFTYLHCDACYIKEFKKLEKLAGDLGSYEPIVFLVSFPETRHLKILAQTYHLKFSIVNIPAEASNNWPLERTNKPYYFCSLKDSSFGHYLIPDKTVPELSDAYMEKMKRVLADN